MNRVLKIKDIKDILGVCDKTAYNIVHQAIATKAFPVFHRGRVYRIPTQPFLEWLDKGGEFLDEC